MTKQEFIAMVKNHMRNFKNSWLNGTYTVENHQVGIKLYGKSITAMHIDGMAFGGVWDIPTQKRVLEIIAERLDRM